MSKNMLDSTQSSTITYIRNYTDVDLSIVIEFILPLHWNFIDKEFAL